MQIIQPNFKYKAAMECLYILLSILYHKYNIRTIVNEKLVPLLRNIYSELAGRFWRVMQTTTTVSPPAHTSFYFNEFMTLRSSNFVCVILYAMPFITPFI